MRATGFKLSEWQNSISGEVIRPLLALFVIFSSPVCAEEAIIYEVNHRELYLKTPAFVKTCELEEEAVYAVLSYDKSALIVSAEGYISMSDIIDCEAGKEIKVHKIPSKLGTLSDINISKKSMLH